MSSQCLLSIFYAPGCLHSESKTRIIESLHCAPCQAVPAVCIPHLFVCRGNHSQLCFKVMWAFLKITLKCAKWPQTHRAYGEMARGTARRDFTVIHVKKKKKAQFNEERRPEGLHLVSYCGRGIIWKERESCNPQMGGRWCMLCQGHGCVPCVPVPPPSTRSCIGLVLLADKIAHMSQLEI